MSTTDQPFTEEKKEEAKKPEPYPLLISNWSVNQLLNEYVRITHKKSRLRRSERQKVITVFNFITKNNLIKIRTK